jgi:vacuolar-type H+-ATPase subunit H|tara:strand:+ start:63 stop:509 length:447 start_codon:yes stop_codon:yes gene_type:complete
MGSSIDKYKEIMSDREIMDSKNPKKKKIQEFIDDETNQIITIFEEEYPELADEFQNIQEEMYEMFARKHMDYGLNNIALGGDIINSKKDKKFSLTGLCIRLTDKISRLKNLLINGRSFVKGEGMEDTFIDIANYGIIGLLVGRNKWKK